MLLFLHGKDTYRLQQKLKEIASQYRKIHGTSLNLEKFDANQISFRELWDNLFQQSIFIKKKLFFLENVFSNETFKNDFLNRIDEISKSPNIIVLFEKKEVAKAGRLFPVLKTKAKCQHFALLRAQKLKNWVKKEFSKYGAEIEESALEKLIDFVGSNPWQMSNEIKKLATYTKKTEAKDIDLFVRPKIEPAIFKTIDALAEGNKKAALRMLQNHLEKGDSPFYILSMINYQFRNLLLVKSGRPCNMHPFVFQKTTALAARFSFEELKRAFHKIFKADLQIKTGKISPEQGLRMLIAEI